MEKVELAALYERYSYLVHRRCLALLRRPADADDALQETFWRASKYGKPTNPDATLGWLYSICSNCCFDLSRKHHRETAEDPSTLASIETRGSETGTRTDGDARAVIGAILHRFDEKTRQIGVLHHVDGFTQEEIAERTGYSRKTVGKKLASFDETFVAWWKKATSS